jgi:hypothetical protein
MESASGTHSSGIKYTRIYIFFIKRRVLGGDKNILEYIFLEKEEC